MSSGPRLTSVVHTNWHLHPCSRLATIDMGPKIGGCAPLGGSGPHLTLCCLGRGLPPYQVASWSTDMGQNWGLCPFGDRGLGPHLTQCRLGQGLSPCQVSSWSIQPFCHNRHGPKLGVLCPILVGLGPHLTQCRMGGGLPPYQMPSWSI